MKKETNQSRRKFLLQLAGVTSSLMLPVNIFGSNSSKKSDKIGAILPLRKLGKTGEEVTMLGLGGFHIGWTTEKDARETIEAALEGGIRFFDSAESYGQGRSEERYGKYLVPKYRDEVFIMTKTQARDAKTAREHLEGSLKRMKTDYIDLWQIHSLRSPDDTDNRLANGVLDVVKEAKKSGKVKYIGYTGHSNPHAHLRMLEKTEPGIFDTVQMPINPVDAVYHTSFIQLVMPKLLEQNIAPLAMKTLADGRFFNKKEQNGKVTWESDSPVIPDYISMEEAIYYAMSLPISVLITGAENASLVKEKIELTKSFIQFSEAEREKVINKVVDLTDKEKVEYYKKV